MYSTGLLGVTFTGGSFEPLLNLERTILTKTLCAYPSGCTSTSFAVKSVSTADVWAQNFRDIFPMTALAAESGDPV